MAREIFGLLPTITFFPTSVRLLHSLRQTNCLLYTKMAGVSEMIEVVFAMLSKKPSKTFMSILIILVLAVFIPQYVAGAEIGVVSADTDARIEDLVESGNIPSLHLCVVSEDKIEWARGFGEETDLDTPFLIGSTQKVFVAISIMQLYENGEIELDADVSDYVPFEVINPGFSDSTITPRMLLSHRSGLGVIMPYEFCYDWQGPPSANESVYYSQGVIGVTLSDYLSECLTPGGQYYSVDNWLSWEPGTEYSYANSGYKLLMVLLETVTNQNISEYMQENIFTPLRMNNTGFHVADIETPQATPYTRVDGINEPLPVWDGEYMMRSSIKDMGHLLIALMNMGEFNGEQILQSETVELMMDNTFSNDPMSGLFKESRWKGYGLGLTVRSHGLYGHGGSTVGFTADCYFNPELKKGLVRLSNVNAILTPDEEEWYKINDYVTEIENLVLTEIGLIPPVGIAEISIIMLAIVISVNVIRLAQKRYKKSHRNLDLE